MSDLTPYRKNNLHNEVLSRPLPGPNNKHIRSIKSRCRGSLALAFEHSSQTYNWMQIPTVQASVVRNKPIEHYIPLTHLQSPKGWCAS